MYCRVNQFTRLKVLSFTRFLQPIYVCFLVAGLEVLRILSYLAPFQDQAYQENGKIPYIGIPRVLTGFAKPRFLDWIAV